MHFRRNWWRRWVTGVREAIEASEPGAVRLVRPVHNRHGPPGTRTCHENKAPDLDVRGFPLSFTGHDDQSPFAPLS